MKKTCGIFLIDSLNKVLVVHPTNHAENIWSIPKGGKEDGETDYQSAIRELKEETNLDISELIKMDYPLMASIGEFNYAHNRKKLVCFLIKFDKPLSTMNLDLKCISYITNSTELECDKIEWKDFFFCADNLHSTQQNALNKILKKYFNLFY